ncbi:helix-turn-helix transcriptional regulator [uncultured Caulobacter sp.]|nr:helix-turn-helix transcriptional regulator [uncultured Caulobacter sp.]
MSTRTPPHPVDLHVGARVRLARGIRGHSQAALGEAIGVSFQQIQKYERGANRLSASTLFGLAVFLELRIEWFFEGLVADSGVSTSVHPVEALLSSREGAAMAAHMASLSPALRRKLLAVVRAFATEDLELAS